METNPKFKSNNKLFKEYFEHQIFYDKKYGKGRTIVLVQKGKFYEIYKCKDYECGADIIKIGEILNYRVTLSDKKEVESEDNPRLVGIPLSSYDNCVKKLIENGYTLVVIA